MDAVRNTSVRPRSTVRLAEFFHSLFLSLLIITLLIAVSRSSLVLVGTYRTIPSTVVITLILILTLIGRLRFSRSAQFQLALCFVAFPLLLLTMIGRLSSTTKTEEWVINSPSRTDKGNGEWFEAYSGPDATYGLMGLRNATAREHHRDFDVTYHTDADGWRVTPTPQTTKEAREIVFLGCSFTWGVGVDDQKTFPWILGTEAWPEYRIRNISCPAWGTVQVAVALDRLLQSGDRPVAVVYNYMLHAQRNYLRRSWRKLVSNDFPFFTIDKGKLTYHGLRKAADATIEDSAELDRVEVELTMALIHHMRESCNKLGVPFIVVNFRKGDGVPAAIIKDGSVPFMDLSDVWAGYFPNDGHPGPDWHRMVAYTLASSPKLSEWVNRPDLYRPKSVSREGVDGRRFHLELRREDRQRLNTKASVHYLGQITRVDGIESPSKDSWRVVLVRPRHRLIGGKKYQLAFRAKGDAARSVEICGQPEGLVDGPAILFQKIALENNWSDFEFAIEPKNDVSNFVIAFWISESSIPVEFQEVKLLDENGREVLPEPLIVDYSESEAR